MQVASPIFEQEVLHANDLIFTRIQSELKGASRKILVATAWFTDKDLFDLLLLKANEGVEIRVIVNDNADNKKLNFSKLVKAGGIVYKIRNNGFGSMHNKFCIVDDACAIHGSYNWTVNARQNNSESVIVTTHQETVAELNTRFAEIEAAAGAPLKVSIWPVITLGGEKAPKAVLNDLPADLIAPIETTPVMAQAAPPEPESPRDYQDEYKQVLDQMINAEVAGFDRSLLRSQGYERSQLNNGDAQVIGNAMDSLYSLFVNDINVVEDKKRRLIGKIQEQRTLHTGTLQQRCDAGLRSATAEAGAQKEEKTLLLATLKTREQVNQLKIAEKQREEIPNAQTGIKKLQQRINDLDQEMVRPSFRWYEFAPLALLALGLLSYLVIFYFSAAYILFFSEADANVARMQGLMIPPAEIFDANAYTKLGAKGGFGFSFAVAFVFLPIGISLIGRILKMKNKIAQWALTIFLTVLVDAAIGYKVAKAIYEVELLTGEKTGDWHFMMALKDTNFYLVFILGSLGLVTFKFLFDKLLSNFEERNLDILAKQLKLEKQQLEAQITQEEGFIARTKDLTEVLKRDNVKLQSEITLAETQLAVLPGRTEKEREGISTDHRNQVRILEDTTAIYISRIENDNLPISISAVKDRMNVFLEGWNDYLHAQYAITVAEEKSKQAGEMSSDWLNGKLLANNIDTRIKAL